MKKAWDGSAGGTLIKDLLIGKYQPKIVTPLSKLLNNAKTFGFFRIQQVIKSRNTSTSQETYFDIWNLSTVKDNFQIDQLSKAKGPKCCYMDIYQRVSQDTIGS